MALGDIGKRLLVAFILIPLFLLILFKGGLYYYVFMFLTVTLAYREYLGLLKRQGKLPAVFPGFISLWAVLIVIYLNNLNTFGLLLAAIPVLFFLYYPIARVRGADLAAVASTMMGSLYLGIGGGSAYLLRSYGFKEALFFFLLIWTFDTGAYVVGSLIGKRRLARTISPAKSVEGLIGGIIWALILIVLWNLIPSLKFLSIDKMLIIAFVIAGSATLGDLAESAIKREAGVKDSSSLLPGHGGALDRIDSIVASAPLYYILLRCFRM